MPSLVLACLQLALVFSFPTLPVFLAIWCLVFGFPVQSVSQSTSPFVELVFFFPLDCFCALLSGFPSRLFNVDLLFVSRLASPLRPSRGGVSSLACFNWIWILSGVHILISPPKVRES